MTKVSSESLAVHSLPHEPGLSRWFDCIRHLPLPAVLSSSDSSHPAARFDILTAAPRSTLRSYRRSHGLITHVSHADGPGSCTEEEPFSVLARHCPVAGVPHPELPFTGGALGYFGYELLHSTFGLGFDSKPEIGLPDMLVGIYDWAVIVDHQLQQTRLVCRDLPPARQEVLLDQLLAGPPAAKVGAAGTTFQLDSPFVSNFSRNEYLQRFERIIDYIHAGDCYQVNLAQCFTASCSGDPWQAFLRLQQHARAPFTAYIEDGEQAVLSFSPERFLRVEAGQVLTQPIKGTRPRSVDPVQDHANRVDLETSRKDRAENLMIVDLLRNDLGQVCATGSVVVENLFETQSFTNVHHLVSTIKGALSEPVDVFRLLAASFPGGSITGTPKKRAMQIIDELETRPRSVYCGAIGYIDRSGNMDSNICIRTLVKDADLIHCWGGGGIVADSVGAEEYQETFDKISIFINNL